MIGIGRAGEIKPERFKEKEMIIGNLGESDNAATVYRCRNMSIAIRLAANAASAPDRNGIGKGSLAEDGLAEDGIVPPYFVLYNAPVRFRADKAARILFRKPEYVFLKGAGNHDGDAAGNEESDSDAEKQSDWILSPPEKRLLMNMLTAESSFSDAAGAMRRITVFQRALILFNFENGLGADPEEAFSLMLAADQEGYLPLDLAMPDYTKL